MGADLTAVIADWSWLEEVEPDRRLSRLMDAREDDETALWLDEGPLADIDGWQQVQGRHSDRLAVYEFPETAGSYKPHFWLANRWESVREHTDPSLRAELDTLLLGLVWHGLDGEEEHIDADFRDAPDTLTHHVLLARTPHTVRSLAAAWQRAEPQLPSLRTPFTAHAAAPAGWVSDFDSYTRLLHSWGHVLTETARRGWCLAGVN